jgi:hypothetical protein
MTKPSHRPDESRTTSTEPSWFRAVVTLIPLLGAVCLWAFSFQSADFIRELGDRLSPDGDAATFSAERIEDLQVRLRFAGGYLLFLAALTLLPALRVAGTLWSLPGSVPGFLGRAVRRVAAFCREERGHAVALVVFVAVNLGLALSFLAKPITCDEAHTSIHFATKSANFIVCNYISPNNHVLHTLAARLSYVLFGEELWALRLPVLVAGCLMVPAAYAAFRAHFDSRTGIALAALVSAWPYLVGQNTSARGYPIVNLAVLVLVGLCPRLLDPRSRGAWWVFVLVAAAGFYTVPVMLYPFAALLAWLALSSLMRLRGGELARFWKRLVVSGFGVLNLTLFLYAPSIVTHGSFFAVTRESVRPRVPDSYTDFLRALGGELGYTLAVWRFDVPVWLLALVALMAVLAVTAFARTHGLASLRLLVAFLVGPAAVVFLTSRVPPARCLTFLLLIGLGLAAAGLASTVFALSRGSTPRGSAYMAGILAVLVAANGWTTRGLRDQQWRLPWYIGYHDAPAAAARLKDVLDPRDRVAGHRVVRSSLHYYFLKEAGRDFTAFHTLDEEMRERAEVHYDMNAEDDRDSVRDVYLIDTYLGNPFTEYAALGRSGYRATDDVLYFAHSRIVRFTQMARGASREQQPE